MLNSVKSSLSGPVTVVSIATANFAFLLTLSLLSMFCPGLVAGLMKWTTWL